MGVCLLGISVVQVETWRADLSARRPLLSVCLCVCIIECDQVQQ